MAGVCSRCELSESYKYWQEFSTNKHKFFKVLLGDFTQYLRIPKKFIECFKGRISRECTLLGPSGNEWKVKIEKKRDDLVFSSGWETFVGDHGLRMTDFLTFKYHGNSSFKVSIFDASGCEREGSYFTKNGGSSLRSICSSSLHIENVGFESLLEAHEDFNSSSMEGEGVSEEREFGRLSEETSSGEEEEQEKEAEQEEEQEQEESLDGGDQERGHCSMPNKRRRSSSKAKQPQKHYVSNRRTVSTEEKKMALEKANSLMKIKKQTKVPTFSLTMSQTNVYRGFCVTIPNKWAVEHMLKESHQVELKIPEDEAETWIVGCRWTPSQCQIRAQWPQFVLENTVEESDVCVFELIQKGKSGGQTRPVLLVHIYRVVLDTVPLTVLRSVMI